MMAIVAERVDGAALPDTLKEIVTHRPAGVVAETIHLRKCVTHLLMCLLVYPDVRGLLDQYTWREMKGVHGLDSIAHLLCRPLELSCTRRRPLLP